jgi:hypothetical protein
MKRTVVILLALAVCLGAQAGSKRKPVRAPAPEPEPVLAAAQGEQIAAAALTYFGDYACEFGQHLMIGLTPNHDGYVDVTFGKAKYTMKPLLSSTGALRLEDVRGRMLLLQIAFKSMLMDIQAGHRVVDDCVHEKQIEARRLAASKPAEPGLGIEQKP